VRCEVDTLYRIHGTNEPESIGHDVSSGCIRMRNESAIDLYVTSGVVSAPLSLPRKIAFPDSRNGSW
jgi:hypothetical protein